MVQQLSVKPGSKGKGENSLQRKITLCLCFLEKCWCRLELNWKNLMWGQAISLMNNPISWINGFIGTCLMHIMPCQKMSLWGISRLMRTQALMLKYQFLCIYHWRLFTSALAESSFNLCLFDLYGCNNTSLYRDATEEENATICIVDVG